MSLARWKDRARGLLDPLVGLLAAFEVSPFVVTWVGLGLHVLAALWIGFGQLIGGAVLLVLAGLCDALDGALARRLGRVSTFGAFLDSTIDRIDETVVLAGVAAYFLSSDGGVPWAVLCVLALGGSLITSYARARAEGLGLECRVGSFERPERVLVLIAGLLLGRGMLMVALLVLTALSWLTVVQRIRHVQGLLTGVGGPREGGAVVPTPAPGPMPPAAPPPPAPPAGPASPETPGAPASPETAAREEPGTDPPGPVVS